MGVSEFAINPLDPPLLGGRVGNWGTPLILRRVYDQTLGSQFPLWQRGIQGDFDGLSDTLHLRRMFPQTPGKWALPLCAPPDALA